MSTYKYLFSCLLITIFLNGCTPPNSGEKEDRIVCTTSIIRDCVQQIVGDKIHVTSLMGAGIDPHAYNPRPSDIKALSGAKMIVYNGLHLEGKMVELLESMTKQTNVAAISDNISTKQLFVTDPSGPIYDPHIWFDTDIWTTGLEGVVKEICRVFPEYANEFKQNFEKYKLELETLKLNLKTQLSSIPKSKRVLITSHDAFHYFGRAFNVEVKALQGISTTQEPGVQDVVRLVDLIVNRKIAALFIEHSVSPKAITAVVESCASKGHTIRIGGTLYSDALGEENTASGTYTGMLKANVTTLIKGLNNGK